MSSPRPAFILGAGFSKAIGNSMPLMSELSEQLNKAIATPLFGGWQHSTFLATDNLELQLSSLAVSQPFLDEATNHRNQALYLQITSWLAQTIYEAQAHILGSDIPEWLEHLVKYWNETRATVITLNYDTLVESALHRARVKDSTNHPVSFQDTYAMRLQFADDRWGDRRYARYRGDVETFTLCKLHGSLSWFRSHSPYEPPLDVNAAKDTFNDSTRASWAEILKRGRGLEGPLLIPPTLVKSGQYENSLIKENWRRAYAGLLGAQEIYVLGYSFPSGDSQMAALLGTSCRDSLVWIVDTDAPKVTKNIGEVCRGSRFGEIGPHPNAAGDYPIREFALGLKP